MRPLGTALVLTIAALTIPSALFAQSAPAHDVPFAHPVRPASPRPPMRPRPPSHRPGHTNNRYPIVIDGSVVDRYLATPVPHVPAPVPAHKPTPRPPGAPDVFEQHSTSNE